MKTKEERKAYAAAYWIVYRETHKEEIAKQQAIFRETHKEEIAKNKISYYTANKIKMDKYSIKYSKLHEKKIKRKAAIYREEHKKEISQKDALFAKTIRGKQLRAKITHKRQRQLGFIPINIPFDNSNGHHLTRDMVVHIPKELHRSIAHNVFTDKGMEEINDLAMKWFEIEKGMAKPLTSVFVNELN